MAALSLLEIFSDTSARKWGGMTRRERFQSYCSKEPTGCIHHAGWRDKDGYPVVSLKVDGRHKGVRASHISLALAGRPVLEGQQVNHHCDNRQCVNPDHLFTGTQGDNVRDMVAKGRHCFGETQPKALLTDEAVRDIRQHCGRTAPARVFAERYGVSESTVYAAKNRQNWGHVDA